MFPLINSFKYELQNDQINVIREGKILGQIQPVNFFTGMFSNKVQVPVGDELIEVSENDLKSVVAPLTLKPDNNPQNRSEAKKCLEVFLKSHGLDERKLWTPVIKANHDDIVENAKKIFESLKLARELSLEAKGLNPCLLTVLDERLSQAAAVAGDAAIEALQNLRGSQRNYCVSQLLETVRNGSNVKSELRNFLQSQGVNEDLLYSTEINNEPVVENAKRGFQQLRELRNELKNSEGCPITLISRVERLIKNSLNILGAEPLHDWEKSESDRLHTSIRETLGDENDPRENRVETLLHREKIDIEMLCLDPSAQAASSTAPAQDGEVIILNAMAAKNVLYAALKMWGRGEIKGELVLSRLLELATACCKQLNDEAALDLRENLQNFLVEGWVGEVKIDDQPITDFHSELQRKFENTLTLEQLIELREDVIYLKEYLESFEPLFLDLTQSSIEGNQSDEFIQLDGKDHPFLQYFENKSAFYENVKVGIHKQVQDLRRKEEAITKRVNRMYSLGLDVKVIKKHFPAGFGTDTLDIRVGEVTDEMRSQPDYYPGMFDYLFKIKAMGLSTSNINLTLAHLCHVPISNTIGTDFYVRSSVYYPSSQDSDNAKLIKLQLWESTPPTRFTVNATNWHGATCSLVAYDLRNINAQNYAEDDISRCERNAHKDAPVILVGTNAEALADDPEAKEKLIAMKEFAESKGLAYCVTSAEENEGLEKLNQLIIKSVKHHITIDDAASAASSS